MGCTSATGVSGPGESLGKQKPENHCGCGCGGDPEEITPSPKRGCVVRYNTARLASLRIGGRSSIKVC